MRYEVVSGGYVESFFRVVASNPDCSDKVYTAIFTGDNAEARAHEYATWKNVHVGGSYRGVNGGLFRK